MTTRQRWTLVCHGHRLRRRLPRRHDRQRRRSSTSARSCRRRWSASSRARPTSSAATSRSWPPCSSWPAPCPTTTAGGGSTPSAWPGSRRPRPCAAWRRRSSCWSSSASLQGAAGALLVPGSLALITHAFDGPERGRAFGIWAASTSALTVARADRRRAPRRHARLAGRVPDQRPAPRLRALGDPDATSRSRATRETTGRFDWLGAVVAALAVGGLAFGRHPRPGQRVGRTPRPGSRSRSGSSRWSPSRS